MSDPSSLLAIASIGATVAGGVAGAMAAKTQAQGQKVQLEAQEYGLESQAQSAEAQAKAYTYQAGVASINARIARDNAAYAMAIGEEQALISGMKTRSQISSTKATQGASGVDVNTGSAVDVRASEAELGEFEQENIRHSAERQKYGYDVKALEQEQQKGLYEMSAEDMTKAAGRIRGGKTYLEQAKGYAGEAGDIGAFSSILGAGASVSDKWLKFGKQGVPGFGTGET